MDFMFNRDDDRLQESQKIFIDMFHDKFEEYVNVCAERGIEAPEVMLTLTTMTASYVGKYVFGHTIEGKWEEQCNNTLDMYKAVFGAYVDTYRGMHRGTTKN